MTEVQRRISHPRPRGREHLFVALMAVVCGLAGAAGAIFFRSLIHFFAALFLGDSSGLFGSLARAWQIALDFHHTEPTALGVDLPDWRRLLEPALGAAIVGPLVHHFAREAKGDGVPEVMESLIARGGIIRPRVAAIKTLASALTLGSGGSAGREAPIVQIGAALGSTLGQLLRLPTRQMRTLVACGSAAGIAAIFNAPIAGALFAVEVILADFAAAQLAPIVIASVVATVLSRLVLGDHPAFVVPHYVLVSPWELGPYVLCGLLAAAVAVAFTELLCRVEDGFERLRIPESAKPAVGGLLVGAIGIGVPHVFGGSYGTVAAALDGQLPLAMLALLLVAKMVATALTLGSGGSGGIFSPCLVLGAVTGGLVGTFAHAWFPASTASSGAYAVVTMGAVLAAATHAPITAIMLVFELTQSIAIIPPIMAACVIATLVAGWWRRDSVYTMKLLRLGIDVFADRDPNVLKTLFVRDLIDREPERIRADASFRDVLDLVVRSRHNEFFVVDGKESLVGSISVAALRRVLFEEEALRRVVVAADLVESPPTVTEDDDLDTVSQLLSGCGAAGLAVLEPASRRVVGVVHQRDVAEAYNRESLRRDLAGGFTARVGLTGRARQVDLGGGYVLAEIEAPRAFVGRSLRELDVRSRLGIQVLLLHARDAAPERIRVPNPDDHVAPGDLLVIAGPEEVVTRLTESLS
jgi:CIC family chloride channel protein